ncbi:uncharacterized protein HD556DRAFT_1430154 [Suillus plorans]|uniref:Uncharacterized protein n=1 Tax=Suillus plorans TaxID=116603 RepID=A0A9P7J3D4_9AGAM|nr:uncharacterized protein HD556DRAFT_1430154 [Suillus plorans]KAG1800758.1 hypothetical protein HD556DRAFT_1430154 [Suillus plorans]
MFFLVACQTSYTSQQRILVCWTSNYKTHCLEMQCKFCNEPFSTRGIKSHEGSCSRKREKKRRNKEFAEIAAHVVEAQKKEHRKDRQRLRKGHQAAATCNINVPSQSADDQHVRSGSDTSIMSTGIIGTAAAATVPITCDTFKTEYHPNSGRAPAIETFSAFGHSIEAEARSLPIVNNEPWQPFTCRVDFEFAELAHQAALNKDQTDKMLALIWQIAEGHAKFTFKSHAEVSKAWDRAATQMTPISYLQTYLSRSTSSLSHTRKRNSNSTYIHGCCGIGHWTCCKIRHWHHTLYGMCSVCTNIMSSLPNNGVPFAFILYADKTHLTSSGHVKAYPVIACCANLPVHIRNGDGIGGGRVVSWLPIVPTDSSEDGKLSYTNLKCVVWHAAFIKLLESIILYSKTGFAHICFDAVMRWLYPLILLLSADYEEQCIMVLIRGLHSNCPCPICLVPSTKLSDLSTVYPTRTIEDAKAFLELYSRDRVAGEAVLKAHGLRPIANALWEVENSNPHETLSFDPLHVNDIGHWGTHFFEELKIRVKALGREAEAKIDEQLCRFDTFPRWRNLNHFKSVMKILFSDGNKLRDITKQMLYAAQNVLTRNEDTVGYALLQCIASYLQLTMYIALDVHTEATLAAGEAELLVFETHLHAYIDIQGEDLTKNWNFPKVHALTHAFPDIRAKGAARNFSTRPNKKQHGPLKRAYLCQMNRKDVANQLDHISVVSELVRSRISHLDEDRCKRTMSQGELEDNDTLDDQPFLGHLHIGAPQIPVTLAAVEEGNTSNPAFQDFRTEFISLQSIVRGALLVTDYDNNGDFFLVDLVDTDMFLHAKSLRSS